TAPRRRTSPRHGRRSDGDGRGSIVSRGSLFQDQLLEREVRHSLAQPVILFLEFFQPLHLIALQAAELLAPAIIRELRHADRANRLANRSSLRQQNIDLAQLRDDLFGLMLLLGHSNVLSNGSIAYFREDHFSGGRPARYRMSVFLNLIGDHPIDTYVGSDLQAYVRLMACWPADKRHRPSDATPREIIESNRDLKFKPLKRSALEDGYVSIVKTIVRSKITELAYRDPFAGVRLRYPATAAPRETAEPLSSTKISDIFAAGVQGGILDEAMLPLLGHLTGRRLGLLVHLKGNDVREKYPGVWVAQTSGITLGKDGVWRRVPIKTNATTTFFILHDFLREIGFIDWAVRQGDNFLFRELIRL